MKNKLLIIIGIILAVIGSLLVLQSLYNSYQLQREYPIDLSNSEEFGIMVIGTTISASWYFPFFITSFLLFRKSKNNKSNGIRK